ncbi:MAG: hypothetical protein ACR2P2_21150 [Nakamurella sp.]
MAQGRLTAALIAVLAICLAGGGAGAYLLGRHQATIAAVDEQSSAVTSTSDTSSASRSTQSVSTASTASAGSPRPSSKGQAAVPPESGSGPASAGDSSPSAAVDTAPVSLTDPPLVTTSGRAPEDTTVVLVGAAANDDPQRAEIRDLLQKHFDSINKRDYQEWKDTVTEPQVGELPEAAWQQAYGTTKDSDISVIAITAKPRQAQVTFRSRQAAAQAPDKKSTCLNWRITVPLVDEPDGGGLLIGRSVTDTAGWQACYSG